MEPTDEALIHACRRGDSAAWEALVLRYQRLIYSIPRRSGLGEEQSAEVFQHVFTTLVEQIDRIQQPAKVKAWLVTTARRETWRVGRQHRSTQSLDLSASGNGESAGLALPDNDPLPDEAVIQLEMQHSVRAGVSRLDERCRKLIGMLFYDSERRPYAEIAVSLGISEGSIGPTRARCLRKLRDILVESGA